MELTEKKRQAARQYGVSFAPILDERWCEIPFEYIRVFDSCGKVTSVDFFREEGNQSVNMGDIKVPQTMVKEGWVPYGKGEEFLLPGAVEELSQLFDQARGFDRVSWEKKVETLQAQKAVWKKIATKKVAGLWSQNKVVFIDRKNPEFSALTKKDGRYYGFEMTLGSPEYREHGVHVVTNIDGLQRLEGRTGFFLVELWNGGVGPNNSDHRESFVGTIGGLQTQWKRRPSDGIRESFSYAEVSIWYHDGIEGVPSSLAREGLPDEPIVLYPR
ncbi:TPA: hypothetical protein DEP94_01100 [Candidatus Nomurabacteria bacterium]|nr:hypothetical protein [Candidatus Nomurabacteria bacterium]